MHRRKHQGGPFARRVEIRLRQRLVHARLIRAKGAAALKQQRDTLEGRTGSRAARPISHDVMHGVTPSLGCHLARRLSVLDEEP